MLVLPVLIIPQSVARPVSVAMLKHLQLATSANTLAYAAYVHVVILTLHTSASCTSACPIVFPPMLFSFRFGDGLAFSSRTLFKTASLASGVRRRTHSSVLLVVFKQASQCAVPRCQSFAIRPKP